MKKTIAMLYAVMLTFAVSAWPQAAAKKEPAKASAAKMSTPDAKASSTKGQAPLDINSASAQDLETLPGIGPATSKKIVAGRPFKRKDELVQKKILSASAYAKIKESIVAKQ